MRLWVFLVCSALLVAARQGSLWQHRRSADTISSIHWINPFVMWKCHWHFIIVWFWSNNMCTHCMCTCDVWQIAYCIPCQSRVLLSLPSSVNEAFEGLDRSAFVQSLVLIQVTIFNEFSLGSGATLFFFLLQNIFEWQLSWSPLPEIFFLSHVPLFAVQGAWLLKGIRKTLIDRACLPNFWSNRFVLFPFFPGKEQETDKTTSYHMITHWFAIFPCIM